MTPDAFVTYQKFNAIYDSLNIEKKTEKSHGLTIYKKNESLTHMKKISKSHDSRSFKRMLRLIYLRGCE